MTELVGTLTGTPVK